MNSLGLQMYTLHKEMESAAHPQEVYRRIKAAGYDSVQGAVEPGMTPAMHRQMLEETGLFPLTYPAYTGGPEGGILGVLQNPDAIMKGARDLRVNLVEIPTILSEYRGSAADYARFAALMNQAASPLASEGIRLLYHHHALELHRFEDGRTGLDILVQETDPELVEFCLDVHWLQAGGVNPAKWIEKMKGRMTLIHYKDYGIAGNTQDIGSVPRRFMAVGEGNIDWDSITAAARAANIRHFVVEQDSGDRDMFDCITASARYMREILGLPGMG